MLRLGIPLAAVAPLVLAFARAGAQLHGGVDIGAARLSQPALPRAGVFTIASEVSQAWLRGAMSADAIGARTSDARWTGQALLSASLYGPPLQRMRWEITASGGMFGTSNAATTISAQLMAREHLDLDPTSPGRRTLFAGAGVARTMRDAESNGALLGQLGGFVSRGRNRWWLAGTVTRGRTQAAVVEPADAITYADVSLFWQTDANWLTLTSGAGSRFGIGGAARGTQPWASASATAWMAPRVAVVASAGRALNDIVRGVPSTRYLSLGLRFGFRDRPAPLHRRARGQSEVPELDVATVGGGRHRLTVHAQSATTVEVTGDFTNWQPVALTRDGDRWSVVLPLSSGSHRVTVRIDGGAWQVPSNLPAVDDDFGGRVGLLSTP